MAHEPDLFVQVPDRFAVTLSGHTHGGQVLLPFLGRPVVPSASASASPMAISAKRAATLSFRPASAARSCRSVSAFRRSSRW